MLYNSIALLLLPIAAFAQQCDIPGFCEGSTIGVSFFDTDIECIQFCQETDGCEWYSYNSDSSLCSAFADCPTLDTSCEPSCVSGENECSSLACFVKGECLGTYIGLGDAEDENACLVTCQDNELCQWFTFYEDNGYCIEYADCDFNEGCEDCVSGQRECEEKVIESKIFSVGFELMETFVSFQLQGH